MLLRPDLGVNWVSLAGIPFFIASFFPAEGCRERWTQNGCTEQAVNRTDQGKLLYIFPVCVASIAHSCTLGRMSFICYSCEGIITVMVKRKTRQKLHHRIASVSVSFCRVPAFHEAPTSKQNKGSASGSFRSYEGSSPDGIGYIV